MKAPFSLSLFFLAAGVFILIMLAPLVAMVAAVSPAQALQALSFAPGREALQTSLAASALAVAIATIAGVPAGYALAHTSPRTRAILLALLALPLAFPPIASGILLLETFGTQSPFGAWLFAHGILFVDSFWGVVLAEFYVSASFVPIISCAAFSTLDPIYEESAKTLGAGPARLFFQIALPIASPNILAGILLAWMRAIGEYGATSIVAYHPTALPVQLYVTLSARGIAPALALSYGFVVLAGVVVVLQWTLRRRVV